MVCVPKLIGRVLFAAFFILAGWTLLKHRPDAGIAIFSLYNTQYDIITTIVPQHVNYSISKEWVVLHKDTIKEVIAYLLLGCAGLSVLGMRQGYFGLACILWAYTSVTHKTYQIKSTEEFLESFKNWSLECAMFGFCLAMMCEQKSSQKPNKVVKAEKVRGDGKPKPGGQRKREKSRSQRD